MNIRNKLSRETHGNFLSMSRSNRRDRGSTLVIVTALVAVVLIAWLSQPSRHATTTPLIGDVEQTKNDDISRLVAAIREFNPWDDTYAQWLMAIFGVAATVISYRAVILVRDTLEANTAAVEQARKANDIARDTAITQQRAWLSFDTWELCRVGDPNTGIADAYQFVFRWRNMGATPASGLLAVTASASEQSIFPDGKPDFTTVAETGGQVVGPGSTFHSPPVTYFPEEILASADVPIRIRAAIQYDTAFTERSCRVTDLTMTFVYIGKLGLEGIKAGKIGPENFMAKPTGKMT